jgi:hypothetical protein
MMMVADDVMISNPSDFSVAKNLSEAVIVRGIF